MFVLIDIRHEPQKIDLEFLEWLGENALSFVIVFTKSDKLTKNKVNQHVKVYKEYLQKDWEEIPQSFVTSAENNLGMEELLNFIETNNQLIPS